jgi:hypothetical protein
MFLHLLRQEELRWLIDADSYTEVSSCVRELLRQVFSSNAGVRHQ